MKNVTDDKRRRFMSNTAVAAVVLVATKCLRLSAALGVAAVALSSGAFADTVPAAVFTGILNAEGTVNLLPEPGTVTSSKCSGLSGANCENSAVTLSYFDGTAAVSTNGSMGNSAAPNGAASGSVAFNFEVFGSINESVPLIFTASGSTSTTGVAQATASASVDTPGVSFAACSQAGLLCGNGEAASFSGSIDFNARPNTMYSVLVDAGGGMNYVGASAAPSQFSASVDPMIQINPTFADASDFSLQFSPNPAVVTPVPEPSTFLLLGIAMASAFSVKKFRAKRSHSR